MNIYFSGIGGVGIGPLAEIAVDAGYNVTGSDAQNSPITTKLAQRGIKVNIGQDGSYLRQSNLDAPIEWFVHTSALPNDHPELVVARELGIKIAKRDELLAQIIKDKNLKLIAIAGTHGKTSTTGLFVWALKQLNIPVSYSVGATLSFGPSGKFDQNSEYFVYECDEFERNFLHFQPELSIITSVDYDHPDTYPTPADYLTVFKQFAAASKKTIGWSDQHGEIYEGLDGATVVSPDLIRDLKIAGLHNRRNATLVQIALERLNINANTDEIIASFPGTDRRFEKLADNLYSDYGHHPAEIAATMQMAREISDHVVLIYQPHQNIRQHKIKDDYTTQFELADSIYWLPTYLSREDPNLPILTPMELITNITNKDKVQIADFNDELWSNIQQARQNGILVLCMGAGRIDSWVREQLAKSL